LGGCRVNPASPLATVGTSNARYVSRAREATERGRRWRFPHHRGFARQPLAKEQSWRTALRARSLLTRTRTGSREAGRGAIPTRDLR
jgi:hypothetical protein